MTDRMAGGDLLAKLTAYRAGGMSWETIAMRLFRDHGIEISAQTLRRWGAQVGLDESEVVAS